jgi:hypothetical protein
MQHVHAGEPGTDNRNIDTIWCRCHASIVAHVPMLMRVPSIQ